MQRKGSYLLLLLLNFQLLNAQYAYKISSWSTNGTWTMKERGIVGYYIYNSDSLLVEHRKYAAGGIKYIYNKEKQKIAEQEFSRNSGNDKITFQKNFIYKDNGQLDLTYWGTRLKKGDSIVVTETYTYDHNGRLTEAITQSRNIDYPSFSESNNRAYGSRTTYHYKQEEGKTIITEYKFYNYRKKPYKTVSVYNEKDLLLKRTAKNERDVYSYEYDSQGNWIVKKVYEKRGESVIDTEHRKTLIDPSAIKWNP